MDKGLIYAAAAYTLWGFFPAFWKLLDKVPAPETLSHRVIWSTLFLVAIITYRRQWQWLPLILRNRKALLAYLGSGSLLGINWFTYIWAVNHGYIVETSLGYYINPLVNVVLGVVFLGEKLRTWQWASIMVAAIGVGWLTLRYGSLPWIALTLALSFGFYGLLRKTSVLGALEGLSLEMGILFLPALAYLLYIEAVGIPTFGNSGAQVAGLLALSGIVTAIPLLLFAAGARRIKLVTLGILQYVAPSLQLLLGVLVYGEPFNQQRLTGFGLIWLALLLYSIEGIHTLRQNTAVRA